MSVGIRFDTSVGLPLIALPRTLASETAKLTAKNRRSEKFQRDRVINERWNGQKKRKLLD